MWCRSLQWQAIPFFRAHTIYPSHTIPHNYQNSPNSFYTMHTKATQWFSSGLFFLPNIYEQIKYYFIWAIRHCAYLFYCFKQTFIQECVSFSAILKLIKLKYTNLNLNHKMRGVQDVSVTLKTNQTKIHIS